MATMRSFGPLLFLLLSTVLEGGRAPWRWRNSQSSRVKMSFVTAAREYLSRRAWQRASMRAVLPEPTGLSVVRIHGEVDGNCCRCSKHDGLVYIVDKVFR